MTLQWRHNGRDGVSNHQPHHCLPNRLFRLKENIKAPRHWPLCGEFTGEFPAKMASNAENVSIWWRHHVYALPGPNQWTTFLANPLKNTLWTEVRGIHRWPVTGEFPAQMASNAENVSIWWRHQGIAWFSNTLLYIRIYNRCIPGRLRKLNAFPGLIYIR